MGWNGSQGGKPDAGMPIRKAAKPRGPSLMRAGLAGLVVVAGAICAWLFLSSPDVTAPEKKSVVKRQIAAKAHAPAVAPRPRPQPQSEPEAKEKIEVISCTTNGSSGMVYQTYRTADGKTHMVQIPPPPVFSNLCDSVLALCVSAVAGERVPPLPPIDEEAFRQSFINTLTTPVHIDKGDSEKTAALKLAVKELKAAMVESIKAGDERDVLQMVRDHVKAVNDNEDLRVDALKEIARVTESEGEDFAAEYRKKVNEHLKDLGIRSLDDEQSEGEEEQ